MPRRFITSRPQRFSQLQRVTRVNRTFAASDNSARTMRSPHLVMPPLRSTSPDAYFRGVNPKCAPTSLEVRKRAGFLHRRAIRERRDHPDTGHRHQQPADRIGLHNVPDQPVELRKPLQDLAPDPQNRVGRGAEHRIVVDQLEYPSFEPARCHYSYLQPECLEDAAQVVLERPARLHQKLAAAQHRADTVGVAALHVDLTIPARLSAQAMLRASIRSVFTGIALVAAFRWRASRQTTGKPAAARPS